jgi:hypothetical protein
MEFRILGPLQVGVAGEVMEVAAAKQRAVLGVLLVGRGRAVSAEFLLEEVWGDQQPRGGVKTLRYHISKLRDFLKPDRPAGDGGVIVTKPGGVICSRLSPTKSMPGASNGWQMRVPGVGLAFGWLAVLAIPDSFIDQLAIPYGTLAVYVVIATIAGLLAASFPARRASRLNILDAIAHT